MKRIAPLTLLALLTFWITSCDDEEDNTCPTSTFVGTVNGQTITVTSANAVLLKTTEDNGFVQFRIKDFTITANTDNSDQLTLTVTNFRNGDAGDCIDAGQYTFEPGGGAAFCRSDTIQSNIITTCEGATATYTTGITVWTSGDGPNDGFIEITKCDEANQTISGEFEIVFRDFLTSDSLGAASGIFTDQCFTVSNQ